MREIKFRAWDKKNKKMITTQIPLAVNFEGDLVRELFGETPCYEYCGHEFEVMQYTGLKDRNNREIFEGDIVKGETLRHTSYRYIGNSPSGKEYVGVLEYVPTGLQVIIADQKIINRFGGSKRLFVMANDKLEIIGNIYENKELLKSND